MAVDPDGNVYVTDALNNRVQKFTSSGQYLIEWGSPGNATGQFNTPAGIAVDPDGNVYVADVLNHRVQKFTSSGEFIAQWFPSWSGESLSPQALAVDADGNVYVTVNGSIYPIYPGPRLQKFTSSGALLAEWGTFGGGDGQLTFSTGVAVDANGHVYVTDGVNRVQKFTSSGNFLARWGTTGSGAGQFDRPGGVAVDSTGNVYVADAGNNRVQKFTSSGTYLTQWGSVGSAEGQFDRPNVIAVEGNGDIYVGEGGDRIQVFASCATPSPGGTASPTITLSVEGNHSGGDALRPTVARRLQPGVWEQDATVGYAELVAEVGATGSCPSNDPVELLLTFGQGLVPVGPSTESQSAGWACDPPEVGMSLVARCTLTDHAPIGPGSPAPTLTYLADVGWDAVQEASAQALASIGDNSAGAIDTIPVKPTIVGMGDSYSSGEGAGSYTPDTAASGGCHRSPASWQHYWATAMLTGTDPGGAPATYTEGFRHIACSGAVSGDVMGDQPGDIPEHNQVNQLRAIRDDTGVDAVVVTIGGNDALFAAIIKRCLLPSLGPAGECQNSTWNAASGTDRVTRRINSLYARMVDTFRTIRRATSTAGSTDHDFAPVYVSGYPRLVPNAAEDANCPSLSYLSQSERVWLRRKITDADSMLRAAASTAGVHYLSVLPIFDANQRCQPSDPQPAVNGNIVPRLGRWQLQEGFHPTSVGFGLWGRAALTQAPSPTANPAPTAGGQPTPYDNPVLASNLAADTPDAIGTPSTATVDHFLRGSEPTSIFYDGLRPDSAVTAYLFSDPIGLGSFPVDATGRATVVLPAGTARQLSFGLHHLLLSGTDVDQQPWERILSVPVNPAPDGRIKKGATGTNRGNDVYNTTGTDQTANGSAPRGGTITYYVSAQNDAPVRDRLRVKGTASTSRFTVTYTTGGTNITSAVTSGTYRTPSLEPGATQKIKVTVTVRTTAPTGSTFTGTLAVASDADRAVKDKVKFVTSRR
ncbi:MAG: SMP-30/gluconolactonase/LRE family protein [Acidimicrobiales bacterium]|nr:SMP-30/gluconolactonase/LRE family protein [Acidimicrobiales bacterium]